MTYSIESKARELWQSFATIATKEGMQPLLESALREALAEGERREKDQHVRSEAVLVTQFHAAVDRAEKAESERDALAALVAEKDDLLKKAIAGSCCETRKSSTTGHAMSCQAFDNCMGKKSAPSVTRARLKAEVVEAAYRSYEKPELMPQLSAALARLASHDAGTGGAE